MSETNLSVPASMSIDFDNKKISRLDALNSILTSKEQLGYKWEFIVQNTLLNLGIHNFEGNPLNPILWKIQGCGYSRYKDNKVDIKTYYFDIECKYVNHRVYPSHVKHNLIPRFTENGKMHVTITNNVKLWSKDARDEARKQNIKIWSLKDLISFYKTPSFISIYNFIRRNVSCTTLLNGYDLKCIFHLKYVSKSNVNSESETERNGAITEERTESSTSREYIVSTTSVGTETRRLKLKEISTVSVKIRVFCNRLKTLMLKLLYNLFHDTSGRLPKTRKWIMSGYGNRSILEYCSDKMKRSKLHPVIKTCPYKTVLICKMKYFKPKYVCGFPFQSKIRYCDYCEDLLDEDNMDLYGRPICKFYNERCDVILQSYEYVNLENSQICYWISRSERVKVLKELEKYRGENRCPNKH
jgi:hypothetical protein